MVENGDTLLPMTWPTEEDWRRKSFDDLAVCEAASPGPWGMPNGGTGGDYRLWDATGRLVIRLGQSIEATERIARMEFFVEADYADLEFMAKARTGWPAALRRVIRAEYELWSANKETERLKEELGRLRCENELLIEKLADARDHPADQR